MKKHIKKFMVSAVVSCLAFFSTVGFIPVNAQELKPVEGQINGIESIKVDEKDSNIVWITFKGGIKGKITFLDNTIFRYNVDPSGKFSNYAEKKGSVEGIPDARIQAQPDTSKEYTHPKATVSKGAQSSDTVITAGDVKIVFDAEGKMSVETKGKVVMQEKEPLVIGSGKTTQTLVKHDDLGENYFGGGTQNGRFIHTGNIINIANESSWTDGGVSSPNPFYYTTNGYGVLRNTFQDGKYDFGKTSADTVTAYHNEEEFDAYYFVSDAKNGREAVQDLLQGYFKVTGNPNLLPEYGFYLGHLNAYNRDAWVSKEQKGYSKWEIKGNNPYNGDKSTVRYERGGTGTEIKAGETLETLNGTGPTLKTENLPEGVKFDKQFSARNIVDEYLAHDIPFGYLLPNDGYGAGYGQNGYKVTGGVNPDGTSTKERLDVVAANVENLRQFAEYAKSKGVETGLWSQSQLTPTKDPNTQWHLLRDFSNEVKAGVTTLKTDVAWVGPGYSFQLSGVKFANEQVMEHQNTRPNIISLDGWAGSQRYNSVWTGDQYGGNWEYIRFHVPTFIGQSLSGNPNIGTDMDGIWGGNPIIATRDYQWKSFAPQMLDMDGWGTYYKSPYTHGDPYTGISRMYLKTKAMMMPYTYTNAYASSNIDTGNGDTGLPMVRAMFLEYPNDPYAYSIANQYQYMWGSNILVAPIVSEVQKDDMGNDVRNGIYLPDENEIWIDYFTGEQYKGGQILNNFDAPIWKLPIFIKNGSIIPMYEEHNVATAGVENGVDKTKRLVEFWPSGKTQFNAIEDDGTHAENKIIEDKEYGKIDNVSYGSHVSTKYESEVKDGTAILIANKSTGTYTGYDANKDTTFIVNASKKPTSVEAFNGNASLKMKEVTSKADFDKATVKANEAVFFYDENPAIETFASADEKILADMVKDVKHSGKLYVKLASTDTQANAQKVVVKGFENKVSNTLDKLDESLKVPTLKVNEEKKTPSTITLDWDEVENATGYQILVDGKYLHNILEGTTFTNTDLEFKSTHTYKIRALGPKGYSNWSKEIETTSLDDPFLYTPKPEKINWEAGIYSNEKVEHAFDNDLNSTFHSGGNDIGKKLTVDYGTAYVLDKIEYYPRIDAGNGTTTKLRVETSLDGKNWVQHGNQTDADGNKFFQMEKNNLVKTLDLSNPTTPASKGIGARYVRFTPLESVGNFFGGREFKVYTITKEDGRGNKFDPFTPGNITSLGTNDPKLADFQSTFLKASSMHGCTKVDAWNGEIANVFGDINFNGISDVYDYSLMAFSMDGGTKQKGSVSGKILLEPEKTSIKAGETFKIHVNAENVKNLNAYGTIINYNPEKLEFVGSSYEQENINEMFTDGMTKAWTFKDGTAYVNHNAINMGDKPLVAGTKTLSTITMKAKTDINLATKNNEDFIIDLSNATLIGPDFSVINMNSDSNIPQEVVYAQDDFDLTLTNEFLPNDPTNGKPNVQALIQQNSFDGLFNGSVGRDWEFKWDVDSNYVDGKLPEYVTLPATLHMNFKEKDNGVSKVSVHNANEGNGYLTKAEATIRYVDGTKETKTIDKKQEVYEFVFDNSKAVEGIDITFKESGSKQQHLTIGEIEVRGSKIVAEEIEFGKDDFNLTMTNDILTEDPTDGVPNVEKLIQQKSYDNLFNDVKTYVDGKVFEFLWNYEPNWDENGKIPEYVKLPTTIHYEFKEPSKVSRVDVYNRESGNGHMTKIKAEFEFEDGTKQVFEEGEKTVYSFETSAENANKKVKAVHITPLAAKGEQMLTICEIDLFGSKGGDEVVVDKTKLQALYDEFKTVDTSIYTEETVAVFKEALTDAEKVLADTNTTQEQVNNVANALQSAHDNLELKKPSVDKNKLSELINAAEQIDKSKYTEETVSKLVIALNNAKTVFEYDGATQEQVNTAIAELQTAIDGLKEKEQVPVTPETPKNPEDEGSKGPGTGDNSNTNAYAGALLISAMAAGFLVYKKRKSKTSEK